MNDSPLHEMSPQALRDLADALEIGTVGTPYTALALRRYAPAGEGEQVAAELGRLATLGMPPPGVAAVLRLLRAEREATRRAGGAAELVWTGPEVPGSRSRETSVVVDELFAAARRSVLVSSYSLWDGRSIFRRLIERMNADPVLVVRLFFNVPRAPSQKGWSGEALVDAFTRRFHEYHWAGSRKPEVFYDPRSLDDDAETKGVLHAKCIVVDDDLALVTSANFSEAAHTRNIEAGVLLRNPALARALRWQFETLVASGFLVPLPG